jgi:hypothetical protein
MTTTGILSRIDSPSGLKTLTCDDLAQLAAEIREEMIKVVSLHGGHLASSLGTVELTIALPRVFVSPRDKIVWTGARKLVEGYCVSALRAFYTLSLSQTMKTEMTDLVQFLTGRRY